MNIINNAHAGRQHQEEPLGDFYKRILPEGYSLGDHGTDYAMTDIGADTLLLLPRNLGIRGAIVLADISVKSSENLDKLIGNLQVLNARRKALLDGGYAGNLDMDSDSYGIHYEIPVTNRPDIEKLIKGFSSI